MGGGSGTIFFMVELLCKRESPTFAAKRRVATVRGLADRDIGNPAHPKVPTRTAAITGCWVAYVFGLLIRSLILQRPEETRHRFHRAQQAGGAGEYAWEVAYKKVGYWGSFVALCDGFLLIVRRLSCEFEQDGDVHEADTIHRCRLNQNRMGQKPRIKGDRQEAE
jgi:hypothetical protein